MTLEWVVEMAYEKLAYEIGKLPHLNGKTHHFFGVSEKKMLRPKICVGVGNIMKQSLMVRKCEM